MSLINDMLRDLDARRVHTTAGNQAALRSANIRIAGATHPGIASLPAGLLLLAALAFTAPLVTDYLEVFDWAGSGDPAVTQSIALPAPIKHKTARRARPEAAGTPPDTVRAQAPRTTMPLPATPDNGSPAVTEDNPVTPSAPAGNGADEQNTGNIILRRHGAGHEYGLAARAAASGNDQEAIRQLEQLLAADSGHEKATLLLASLYIQQQQIAQAESLLSDALARRPRHVPYARLLANLLAADNRHEEAITHLVTALPGATQDASYHALLAGLYQHTGDPAMAAGYFTRALSLSPDHGEWWMGLGISQEQSGDRAAAYKAYNRALEFRLAASLRDYISERLRLLTRNVATGSTTG